MRAPAPALRRRPAALLALALCAASPPLGLGACSAPPRGEPRAPPPVASTAEAQPAPPAASAETPDAEFRKKPPPGGPEGSFQAPVPADARLSNGMRVLLLANHGMPVVSMQVVIQRGGAFGAPGAASLLGPLLLQGTPSRSALEFSDAFEEIGARHRVAVDDDALVVSATTLAPDAERALMLLADAVRNPTLPEAELSRLRARKIQALAADRDLPRVQLQRAVAELLYPPGHPYRAAASLGEPALKALTRGDLLRFHQDHVRPSTAALVVAGDVNREALLAAAERAFGSWRGRAAQASRPPAPPAAGPRSPKVLLVDTPGAPQTSVALCAVGAPRTSPDYDALQVLATLLSRRLNANLRGRHGYTYGASAQFAFRHGPGPFTAGGEVVADKTAEAVREALGELARLRDELVGHDELADTKAIVSALSARFETAESTVIALTPLAVYGLEDGEFMTLRVRLQMVTRESLQKIAQTYLAPERLRLALVGDASRIEAKIRTIDLGPVEVKKGHAFSRKPPAEPADE